MTVDLIAIDGPAASGKSTIAKRLSEALCIPYVSTGAMYRAVAWKAIQSGLDMGSLDEKSIAPLLERIDLKYSMGHSGRHELELDGLPLGQELRSPEVAASVSTVAALPNVRAKMSELQRAMAGKGRIVMEGRDIGTCVFPDARYKFFLTASPYVRAKRRLAQEGEIPDGATVDSVAKEIAARDKMDMERAVAPLKKADDAMLIDSSEMSVENVLSMIMEAMKTK